MKLDYLWPMHRPEPERYEAVPMTQHEALAFARRLSDYTALDDQVRKAVQKAAGSALEPTYVLLCITASSG